MNVNDKDNAGKQGHDPATEEAKKLADHLETLGVTGVKDAKVIKVIADKINAVNERPDRDVGH